MEFRAGQLAVRDDLRAQMASWRVEKEARQVAEATPVTPLTIVGKDAKIVQMRRRIFQYASAAVILLAIGFVARWAMQPQGLSGIDMAQQFYEEPSFGTKSGADTSLIVAAERLVEQQKDYKGALQMLQNIKDPSLIERNLSLKAHCEYKLGDFATAATTLQTLVDATIDPLSKQPAEWRWLLMKLAANQRDDDFKTRLQSIENDGQHQYQNEAKRLKKLL
jgi:tetratricopeptide (TPR) repeat protein